jgi:hypothetical protein
VPRAPHLDLALLLEVGAPLRLAPELAIGDEVVDVLNRFSSLAALELALQAVFLVDGSHDVVYHCSLEVVLCFGSRLLFGAFRYLLLQQRTAAISGPDTL